MKKMKHTTLLLCLLACSSLLHAQDPEKGFVNTMRSNGKIYVVIAVLVTILLGLILYVARLDRKMSKLEKNN